MKISKDYEEIFESLNNNDLRCVMKAGGYAHTTHTELRITESPRIWIQTNSENGRT